MKTGFIGRLLDVIDKLTSANQSLQKENTFLRFYLREQIPKEHKKDFDVMLSKLNETPA